MTETEWLTCTDPRKMLVFLRGKAVDRKLRLFACAYCRLEWHLLFDKRSREAVEVAEQYADGLATERDRKSAASRAFRVASRPNLSELAGYAATAVCYTIDNEAGRAASKTCDADAVEWYNENGKEMPHPRLLREIFGNPFRLVALDPNWRTPSVTGVAQAIYTERRFADLPILADALEEAGCTSADILDHCRKHGKHVLGCWALDLVLGKE